MIFVAGTMTFDPAILDAFTRDVAAMRPKVIEEDGCLHYSLLVEDAAAGLVNVMEQWTGDATLLAHLHQPWTGEFFAKYGPQLKGSTVQVFDISGTRPLPEF
jgi:quinol monooxygenase YgiN